MEAAQRFSQLVALFVRHTDRLVGDARRELGQLQEMEGDLLGGDRPALPACVGTVSFWQSVLGDPYQVNRVQFQEPMLRAVQRRMHFLRQFLDLHSNQYPNFLRSLAWTVWEMEGEAEFGEDWMC